MMGKSIWTDEMIARLRDMLGDPQQSASTIGRTMCVSRCAVIGKTRRLGLSLPNPAPKQTGRMDGAKRPYKQRKAAAQAHSHKPVPRSKADEDCTVFKHRAVGPSADLAASVRFIDALNSGGCLFPTGGMADQPGPDMLCCGGAALGEMARSATTSHYCKIHAQKCTEVRGTWR